MNYKSKEHDKVKTLQAKLETANNAAKDMKNPPGGKGERKHIAGGTLASRGTINPRVTVMTSNLTTETMPLLNTIIDLQRENKILKSKTVKDKLDKLSGEDSYVNRYIKKVSKAYINETKDDLNKIENELEELNNNYKV